MTRRFSAAQLELPLAPPAPASGPRTIEPALVTIAGKLYRVAAPGMMLGGGLYRADGRVSAEPLDVVRTRTLAWLRRNFPEDYEARQGGHRPGVRGRQARTCAKCHERPACLDPRTCRWGWCVQCKRQRREELGG